MTVFRQPDSTRPPEGLSEGHENESPARDPRRAQSTGATTPPKWAELAHELDILTTEALTTTPWWDIRVEPRLVLDLETEHLRWTGGRSRGGYGYVQLPRAIAPRADGTGGRLVRVHRAALVRHLGGPLPYGLTVDHVCGDRLCANPEHLEAVPQRVNTARAEGVGQSGVASRMATGLCPRGHAGSWRRDIRTPDSWGCAECNRQSSARVAEARRGAFQALGLTQRAYAALFGWSETTAHNVLAALALGRDPASIVAGARIALEANEREGVLAWLDSLTESEGGAA